MSSMPSPTALLPNHVEGRWQTGTGPGTPLFDPVLGTELARVSSAGLDLPAAFAFARDQGGRALRALGYRERAALLTAVVNVLQAHKDDYYAMATANSGTVTRDSAVDIDGGIFTLSTYARLGERLGDARCLLDGERSAYREIFDCGGTLYSMDAAKISNLDKAQENAKSFASEVMRLLPVKVIRSSEPRRLFRLVRSAA